MYDKHFIWAAVCSIGILSSNSYAAQSMTEGTDVENLPAASINDNQANNPNSLKNLKHLKAQDFKVNANAAQADEVKDPLQPLNRKVHAFNDAVDRTIVRPIAVQYQTKIPSEVRGSYHQFRTNLGEPWNAVNQVAQGRPKRAAKTIGRFTLNTLTTLGFADPASRVGLTGEDENLGTTLGYYGVPSGPYIVLPIFGPSTVRDAFGLAVDSFGRPQTYLDQDSIYWTDQSLRALDARSILLDYENVLQGDKYAAIRDVYLQRKNFVIAEKRGDDTDSINFIDDDSFDIDDADDSSIGDTTE
jgi:phospholipid-binding lipoprotein MlaA